MRDTKIKRSSCYSSFGMSKEKIFTYAMWLVIRSEFMSEFRSFGAFSSKFRSFGVFPSKFRLCIEPFKMVIFSNGLFVIDGLCLYLIEAHVDFICLNMIFLGVISVGLFV